MFNLLIFGSPGVGKGTQAELLAKKHGLIHLSSGQLLRQERENDLFGQKIKKYQDAGRLVPNSLTIKIVEDAISKNLAGPGFIFDGYPRNLSQAQELDRFLKAHGTSLHLVLNLKLSAKEATHRIMERSHISGRSDDRYQVVTKRLEIYRELTSPLLNYYKKQKKLENIDGRPNIKEVFLQVNKTIATFKKENKEQLK